MAFASLEQISTVLNMTPTMVNRHVKLHGLPRVGRGEYDLIKCVHWYIAYKDKQIQEARRGTETEAQARQRLTVANANIRELEYAKANQKVIAIETVQILCERMILAFKNKIMLIPSKLPTLVLACKDPNEVRELLQNEVTEALKELSNAKIATDDLSQSGPVDGKHRETRKSTSKTKRKRVGRSRKTSIKRELSGAGKVEDSPGGISTGNDGRDHGSESGDSDTHDISPGG